ncbi:MAG: transglutaminase family protein [Verrucomicrobia bacterium]|nr:transglutaminase family protein [Verrucomicrobiota bacterium]
MARYHIHHITRYNYSFPVAASHHSAHLEPSSSTRQTCHSFDLKIHPQPSDLSTRVDFFGNTMHLFSVPQQHSELLLEVHSDVSILPIESPMPELSPTCDEVKSFIDSNTRRETNLAEQFIYASPLIPRDPSIEEFAAKIFLGDRKFLEAALELNSYIFKNFTFDPDATDVSTPVATVFKERKGVCQDFAHFMIAAIRSCGLPASYVSGYILTTPPPGQPRLIGADASHAWVSIFVPGLGWVDLDPTNNKLVNDEHITIARGRDYSDVSLVRGAVFGGGEQTLDIEVTVTPTD